MGNIDFEENEKSYADITPSTVQFVEVAADLFGLSDEALGARLTSKTVSVVSMLKRRVLLAIRFSKSRFVRYTVRVIYVRIDVVNACVYYIIMFPV